MSQQNVDLVRMVYAEPDGLTASERVSPDFELDLSAVYLDQPPLRGIDEVRRFRESGPWGASRRFEPERYFDVDDERVLVFVRATATGEGSGAPVEVRMAQEFTVRAGLVVRIKVYPDRAEALKAVGLSGVGMSQENVEIVRRTLTARKGEDLAELLDPTVRLDLSERVFNPAVYEGYEGLTRWRADVEDVWESYRAEPEEFFEGDEVVVAFTHERGRGRGSGVNVDRHVAFLCRFSAGRVSEIRLYLDREQALRDAGLAR